MIIATPHQSRKGYQAIVYGRFGGGEGKIKFYPSPEALGLDRRDLTKIGLGHCLDRPNEPYVRYLATADQVKTILTLMLDPEVWAVCPTDQLVPALTGQLGRDTSLERHPRDHEQALTEPVVVDQGLLTPA